MSFPKRLERDRSVGIASGREVPVELLGRAAAQALRAESDWEVRAVFRRSLYCQGRRGGWVCVGLREIGAGPLNVLCAPMPPADWEARRPAVGASGAVEGSWFWVGEGLVLRLADAAVWRPDPPPQPWRRATLRGGLEALAQAIPGRPSRGGFQPLIPWLAGRAGSAPTSTGDDGPLARRALAGIGPLSDWIAAGLAGSTDPLPVPGDAVEALIGLGPGLTPSGDDLLGGVLVALRQLGVSEIADRLAQDVAARAAGRTGAISRAHLAAAAGGEGAAPLHALLAALCTPGAPGLQACLAGVEEVGHSSGWDAVAGLALAAARVVGGPAGRGGAEREE